jgi:hypothetical protein
VKWVVSAAQKPWQNHGNDTRNPAKKILQHQVHSPAKLTTSMRTTGNLQKMELYHELYLPMPHREKSMKEELVLGEKWVAIFRARLKGLRKRPLRRQSNANDVRRTHFRTQPSFCLYFSRILCPASSSSFHFSS